MGDTERLFLFPRAPQGPVRYYSHWCVCVCVCVLVTQSCPTLCDPMDYNLPGSSVHGILQARILVRFPSVTQSCLTLSDPMDYSTPGFPVHHQLPELAQTHIHWVSDAIQPSHPLSCPSPPAFNRSQIQIFSNESVLCIRWPKYWSFSFNISPSNEHSGLISFRMTGLISLQSRDSQELSLTPQFKIISSLMVSFIYSPTLTSIHDYWKNHSFH